MKKSILFIALGVLSLFLSSCRFKAPTIEEQRELMSRGSFAGSAPSWVAKPVLVGSEVKHQGPGIIPIELGSSSSVIASKRPEPERKTSASNVSDGVVTTIDDEAPLLKINRLCSDLEDEVNAAITTLDIQMRISRYRSLTSRCPNSDDLWLWLAEDYYQVGDTLNARHSAQKALSLNASKDQARILLDLIAKKTQGR